MSSNMHLLLQCLDLTTKVGETTNESNFITEVMGLEPEKLKTKWGETLNQEILTRFLFEFLKYSSGFKR
jgi:hypothetical protein